MANHFRNEGNVLPIPTGTAYAAGIFVQIAGQAGLVNEDIAANQQGSAVIRGVVHVDAEGGAVTTTDGESIYYNATNNTAQNTSGDFVIGTAVGVQTAVAAVKILLNG